MSNQIQIKYMLASLKNMNQQLGADKARKVLAGTQFDFIQEEFLTERHNVEKYQDIKERQGLTTKNADIPHKIREGVKNLEDLLEKLKKQYQRLEKKKKDQPDVLKKKKLIVQNCQLLYRDIVERFQGQNNPNQYQKPMTLTDMKQKLLNQIDDANYVIHHRADSEDKLSAMDDQQLKAIDQFKKKDQQQDIVIQDITLAVRNVRAKVKNINEKQDEINVKIDDGNKTAAQLQKRIKTDNQKLKVIIQKMKPNRCCLGMFLLLLLIGLVVVIIKFLIPQEGAAETPATTTT